MAGGEHVSRHRPSGSPFFLEVLGYSFWRVNKNLAGHAVIPSLDALAKVAAMQHVEVQVASFVAFAPDDRAGYEDAADVVLSREPFDALS
jgi:hypothetical protein